MEVGPCSSSKMRSSTRLHHYVQGTLQHGTENDRTTSERTRVVSVGAAGGGGRWGAFTRVQTSKTPAGGWLRGFCVVWLRGQDLNL